MSKYSFVHINIGDKITYKDRFIDSGLSGWKVTGKIDNSILYIEKTENGTTEKRMIDVSSVDAIVTQ